MSVGLDLRDESGDDRVDTFNGDGDLLQHSDFSFFSGDDSGDNDDESGEASTEDNGEPANAWWWFDAGGGGHDMVGGRQFSSESGRGCGLLLLTIRWGGYTG